MVHDNSIASLRSRVTALVEQESVLLTQAFELSRAGGDRRGVDALFAQVQAKQVERNSLKKQIGDVLGTHRLHVASEVWKPGIYDYCSSIGGQSVRVCVANGPIGLQVHLPDQRDPVNIGKLKGTFDGPLAGDGAPQPRSPVAQPAGGTTESPETVQAHRARMRARAAKKSRT